MSLEGNWYQLILNTIGPADEDIEYFSLLPFRVEACYLQRGAPWDTIVEITLKLLKEILANNWIVVHGYIPDSVPDATLGPDVMYEWIRSKWEAINFRFPLHGEVMWYELSPTGRAYYRENRKHRIWPSGSRGE